MVLPARPGTTPSASVQAGLSIQFPQDSGSLFHPSTIIHSASLDSAPPTTGSSGSGPMSPSSQTVSSRSYSFIGGRDDASASPVIPEEPFGTPIGGDLGDSVASIGGVTSATQQDAFQALVAGELPPDRILIGDGQKLTPTVIDLFTKVDTKLRVSDPPKISHCPDELMVQKHFSILLREGDTLARRVLDDELAALTMSLTHGPPLKFDVMSGLSANGNSFYGGTGSADEIYGQ